MGFVVIGYEFHKFTHVDLVTSLLSFTPGGIEAMIATVDELGGDAGLVLGIQLTRMLILLFVVPLLTNFVVKKEKSVDIAIPFYLCQKSYHFFGRRNR